MSKDRICHLLSEALDDEKAGEGLYEEIAMLIDTTLFEKEVQEVIPIIHRTVEEMAADERKHRANVKYLKDFLKCEV